MGDEKQKPTPTPKETSDRDLAYLKKNPETPLPPEIRRLLRYLAEENTRLRRALLDMQIRAGEGRDNRQEEISKAELRIRDIERFKKLLYQHADNPDVQEVSDAMNQVYEWMFGVPPGEDYRKKSVFGKLRELFVDVLPEDASRDMVHRQYVKKNEALDDTLDKAQSDFVNGLAEQNHPDAFFESYVTSLNRYDELLGKIYKLPKTERDQNIDEFMKTLDFYASLTDGRFAKHAEQEIEKAARAIIENQEDRFKGLRGFIQRGIEKGTDFAINHMAGLFGDENSFARNLFIKAAKLGVDLSKPVQYDPKLIEELKQETISEVNTISSAVDPDKVEAMRKACVELKAVPEKFLQSGDASAFTHAFHKFWPVTVALMQRTLSVQTTLLHDAYRFSHGEANSEFPEDSTLRAKFFRWQGRDLLRTAQVYSPFGLFLPAQAERKDGSPVYLESAYRQGWFRRHPLLSGVVQSAEFGALYVAAYGTARFAANRFILTRLLTKALKKPLGKIVPVVGEVLLGYEIVKEMREIQFSSEEKAILELIAPYQTFEEVSDDVKADIRQLILRNEIDKRRSLFQAVGYDLGKLDMNLWDRFVVANLATGEGDENSMKAKGTFREAMLAANRKLVLLSLEPFEID